MGSVPKHLLTMLQFRVLTYSIWYARMAACRNPTQNLSANACCVVAHPIGLVHTSIAQRSMLPTRKRRLSMTASVWRRRISAAFSLGSRMRPFEATHVMALFFPVMGMLPAVLLSVQAYYLDSTAYRLADEEEPMMRFTPIMIYPEPFAGLSNLSYIAAGIALFLMPVLSGSFLAPHAIGAGVFFAVVGAGSWAFHKDASRTGSWQHAADRIGMFATFSYLGVAVLGGAFHSLTGKPVTPRSRCALLTNLTCMLATVVCITYQDHINTASFLGLFGTVVVAANSLTVATLAVRRASTSMRSSHQMHHQPKVSPVQRTWSLRCGHLCTTNSKPDSFARCQRLSKYARLYLSAIVEGSVEAAICCSLLFVGLDINSTAAGFRDAAAHNSSLSDAARINLRARHDMLHGTWHCLSAIALLAMAMTMHRGLCSLGRDEGTETQAVLDAEACHPSALKLPPPRETEEQIAKVLCLGLALLMWVLKTSSPKVVLCAWAFVVGLVLPLGVYALRNVTRRVDARWAAKRYALGATCSASAFTKVLTTAIARSATAVRTRPPLRAQPQAGLISKPVVQAV